MADLGQHAAPSRYKSQRRKQASIDAVQPAEPSLSPATDDGIVRSKSRYHRKPGHSSPPQAPAAEQQPNTVPSRYRSKHRTTPLKPLYQEQVVQTAAKTPRTASKTSGNEEQLGEHQVKSDSRHVNHDKHPDARKETSRPVAERRGSNKQDVQAVIPPRTSPPTAQPSGELYSPKAAEHKNVDGPPQSGKIRATKSMSELPEYDEGDGGCFAGMFKRKRGDGPPPVAGNAETSQAKTAGAELPAAKSVGMDAPVSAINAGDRHVLVECRKSKALFPVTPTTTPVDLIKSAATCMPERIDVKSAILLEYFGTVGVQRPLRRYEHVRDVMNSWDNDRQNSLILVDPGTGSVEPELTLAGVPKYEPEEDSWCLSYSQKVGKWDKRFITLRPTGQIVCQKDPDKAKEIVNVCHLSDFDIYTPTPEKLKKKIKPPKKICFAIKSQQKTGLFESTLNFVHFFSTSDRPTADSFYNAVQSWRSWYLVNMLGEGKKELSKSNAAVASPPRERSTSNENYNKHHVKGSMDSHYQLGSFKPMIDMDHFVQQDFDQRPTSSRSDNGRTGSMSKGFAKSANQFDVNVSPERRTSTARRKHPPVALNNKAQLAEDEPLANLGRNGSVKRRSSTDGHQRLDLSEFRDTGLLGRNYSQRRKEVTEKETQRQDPFTSGPNLLNGGFNMRDNGLSGDGVRRNPSTRQAGGSEVKRSISTRDSARGGGHMRSGSGDLDRSASRRQKPKPLVDLTPQYKEPPQHSKKGRGFLPDTVGAGGLISNATSPEDPLGIPSSTVFRKTSGTYGAPESAGLIDLTPQHMEPIHHARKGRGFQVEHADGGLVGNATSPEDPLGLPQNNVFRSLNAMPEGRKRAGSISETAQPMQRQVSMTRSPDGFTGEGLLAASSNRQGWGTTDRGRGVADGSQAAVTGRPLVDLSENSRFAQGSLLNKVEKAEGIPAPVIDRERRIEKDEKYGEGF